MTTGTIEWPFYDGDVCEIVAIVDYTFYPAEGDGWNEPREDAHCSIDEVTLIRRNTRWQRDESGKYIRKSVDEPIKEPTPKWVLGALMSSAALQDAMIDDVGEMPSRADVIAEARYDEMRGK